MKKKNVASKPTLKVGDKVRVAVRFGETGTITEIKDSGENRFGIEFKNMGFPLFYKESEIQLLGPNDKEFSWFRH